MAVTRDTRLTGRLTWEHRKGTLIDWNYSYPATGTFTSRFFRSGTPQFMAFELLDQYQDPQTRTVRHDLESFFAVALYMATKHRNDAWVGTPLQKAITEPETNDGISDRRWKLVSNNGFFQDRVLHRLSPQLKGDKEFGNLLTGIRNALYPPNYPVDPQTAPDELFKLVVLLIDRYCQDTEGEQSLAEIDQRKGA